jgi:hypothetical protein
MECVTKDKQMYVNCSGRLFTWIHVYLLLILAASNATEIVGRDLPVRGDASCNVRLIDWGDFVTKFEDYGIRHHPGT